MTTTTKQKPTAEKSGAVVDPRMRARRTEVARGEGRKRLRTVLALATITVLSVGALALLQSSFLDVNEVVVVGNEQADTNEIINATGIEPEMPLVELDLTAAEFAVSRVPWVHGVEVERSWKGRITVTVSERAPHLLLPVAVPAGQSAGSEGFAIIDRSGRQLDTVATRPFGFVPIAGVEASGVPGELAPSEIHGIVALLDRLTPERLAEIDQIVVDERTIFLQLSSGGRARLGNDSGLGEKLVSLDTILASVDLRCLWEIDVRVPAAPTVTRQHADGRPAAPLTDLSTCT